MTKKQKEWKTSVTWKCLTCPGEPEFENLEFMAHFREVHNLDPKTTKGTKTGVMFLDGQGFSSNTFEWEVGEIKFRQYINSARV